VTSSLTVASILVDVGRGLREGFFMFWETLWPLVLGFTLSGVVQAFVSREKMQSKLGDHGPASVIRASGYGMVSSSCSYAASAMSKSLFAKGADFTVSMIFMIASTNLVVELGIVILVLLGWQFTVAEFIGGPIMIFLLAITGGLVFTKHLVAPALKRVRGETPDGHDHAAMVGVSPERQDGLESEPWSSKLRSPAAWSDASSYAVADVTMLRKELAIGYTVAGMLAVLVPTHFWNSLFLNGHGFWTSLENVLVGPIIAVISWVCSVGNIPLALVLWSGGISFGGVIAFIFADLIAMPLILIYRKFYGWKLTLRIVLLFYLVMAAGGLLTEGIFWALGAIPTNRRVATLTAHFEWNYTTYLNFVFVAVAVAVWWMAKNKERFGGGKGYALDPVCGMQVATAHAPASTMQEEHKVYFCSDRCLERFSANPERFASKRAASAGMEESQEAAHRNHIDPVCGMAVDPETAVAHRVLGVTEYFFCGAGCASAFDDEPERYTSASSAL
jgi:YHS domain-containing protein